MNIWLIMSGEPLEMFGERPHRIGILSKMLADDEHRVTWWTTTYDHQHKKYFFRKDTEIVNSNNIKMVFLHSNIAYKKNMSFERIINYRLVSLKFRKLSKIHEKPDIILCAFPSIDLAYEAVNYGKKHSVPVVTDVRDLWPDIFLDVVPMYLRGLMVIALSPLYRMTRCVFKNTYAITGITDEFVGYGLNYGKRDKTGLDKSFPFGYPVFHVTEEQERIATKKLRDIGTDFNKFIICYFGTIGKQFDFAPIIEAAEKLHGENIQFVLCGNGDNLEILRKDAGSLQTILVPGWLSRTEITTLMRNSKIALLPYVNKKDFLNSISNKIIEYFAGGLPVLSNIVGLMGNLIHENNCGFVYNGSGAKLAQYIVQLKSDEKLYHEMSSNALHLFSRNFSAEIVYSKMIEHLKTIMTEYKKSLVVP